ncbi:MAG: methyltransferase [Muribaculaceae bacterium]|nr:methyltransferase [Muribaculaceae bacterium]
MSFTFRQFHVNDENCAMKVGTDAVLLGAWLPDDILSAAHHAVDVGTGSGIISLMLMQRNPALRVTALEIEPAAALDCKSNFEHSPWGGRTRVVCGDFREYKPEEPVDLVVCNPPYFAHSLNCPGQKRNTARHQQSLSYHTLFPVIKYWPYTKETAVALVSPFEQLNDIIFEGTLHGFHPYSVCRVSPRAGIPPNRVLILFRRSPGKCVTEQLSIRQKDNSILTTQFQALTATFYL